APRRDPVWLLGQSGTARREPARARKPALHAPPRQPRGRVPQAHRPRDARMTISRAWLAVWRRNYLVWKKLAAESVLGNIIEPLFYLVGFGIGFGALVPEVDGVKYIAYLAGGTICYSTMMSASFEALYSGFARMHVQRTWEGIL